MLTVIELVRAAPRFSRQFEPARFASIDVVQASPRP
jgi:hypothetical protein